MTWIKPNYFLPRGVPISPAQRPNPVQGKMVTQPLMPNNNVMHQRAQVINRSHNFSASAQTQPGRVPVQAKMNPRHFPHVEQPQMLGYRAPTTFPQPGAVTIPPRYFNKAVVQPMYERAMSPRGTVYEEEDAPSGKTRSKRTAAGFDNPPWHSKEMIPLTEAAAITKAPAGSTHAQKKKYYSGAGVKFKVEGGAIVAGKKKTILGHKHGHSAGQMWNTARHKRPRSDNLEYNRKRDRYHGLESSTSSSASGSSEPRYKAPTPVRGSHRSHFDRVHPDFFAQTPFTPWKVIRERGDTTPLPPGKKPVFTKHSYSHKSKTTGKITYRSKPKRRTPRTKV